jgi:hypothetical protein
MVLKNKAVVCCLLATSTIMLSEKKKRKRKMWSKKWYLKRNISCDAHLLNELLETDCLEMMPSWCRQVNCGNSTETVNATVFLYSGIMRDAHSGVKLVSIRVTQAHITSTAKSYVGGGLRWACWLGPASAEPECSESSLRTLQQRSDICLWRKGVWLHLVLKAELSLLEGLLVTRAAKYV